MSSLLTVSPAVKKDAGSEFTEAARGLVVKCVSKNMYSKSDEQMELSEAEELLQEEILRCLCQLLHRAILDERKQAVVGRHRTRKKLLQR